MDSPARPVNPDWIVTQQRLQLISENLYNPNLQRSGGLQDQEPVQAAFGSVPNMTAHPEDREASLRYVRDMLLQLKVVSGAPHNSLLGYFLEMARLEAEHQLTSGARRSEK